MRPQADVSVVFSLERFPAQLVREIEKENG